MASNNIPGKNKVLLSIIQKQHMNFLSLIYSKVSYIAPCSLNTNTYQQVSVNIKTFFKNTVHSKGFHR